MTETTTWKVEAGGSVSWGIGKVEVKIDRDVASSFSAGTTVTNTMLVQARNESSARWARTPSCSR